MTGAFRPDGQINIDVSGRKTLSTEGLITQECPYYSKAHPSSDTFLRLKIDYTAPARRSGEGLMLIVIRSTWRKGVATLGSIRLASAG